MNPKKNVALRKESVDRNGEGHNRDIRGTRSLSARRAWIEMVVSKCALLYRSGRSPQGERG